MGLSKYQEPSFELVLIIEGSSKFVELLLIDSLNLLFFLLSSFILLFINISISSSDSFVSPIRLSFSDMILRFFTSSFSVSLLSFISS